MYALIVAVATWTVSTGLEQNPAAAAKMLQGEWRAVELEREGQKAPPADVERFRMVITGDEIAIGPRKSKFAVDPSKTPKTIDLTPQDGPQAGKVVQGIYSLDGDRLRICIRNGPGADERPREFATPANTGLVLLTMERVKK